jgi:hypothetical protein
VQEDQIKKAGENETVLSGYFIYTKPQTTSPTASHSYARSVTAFVFILCRAAKNEPRKRAKTFPLGTPFSVPRYIVNQEIDIKVAHTMLQGSQHARQAKKMQKVELVKTFLIL